MFIYDTKLPFEVRITRPDIEILPFAGSPAEGLQQRFEAGGSLYTTELHDQQPNLP